MEKDPLAIVCILPEGDRGQRRVEIQTLLGSRTGYTKHPDGVELEFPFSEEAASSLLDFIFFERCCCQGFHYELGFPPPHHTVILRLRAPAEQVEALQAIYC